MKGQFEKYVNLIRDVAWKTAKKYNLDYDDMESQGYFIYVMALESYDVTKSSFSTYLYIQLQGRLNDYALKTRKINEKEDGVVYELDEDEYKLDPLLLSCESKNYDLQNKFIRLAKKKLDADSYKVFEFLIGFEWMKDRRKKPTITDVMRKFKVNRNYASVLWNNCRNFWKNFA